MTDTQLPVPVREVLRDDVDEMQLQRVWQGVRSGTRRPRRLWPSLALVTGVVAAIALGVVAWWPSRSDDGVLRRADGRALTTLASGVTELSDGSRITTAPASELELLDNSGDRFALALRRGRARFSVVPGGPRTWRVDSGPVTVEVVGTVFVVDRAGERVSVTVERGTVLVRGDGVPDRVRRLSAGENIVVGDEVSQAPTPSRSPAVSSVPRPADPGNITPARGSPAPRLDHASPVEGTAATAASTPDPVAVLLAEADRLTRSGQPHAALAPLLQIVREHSEHEQAALAAVTLGRLYLDTLGDAEHAAWAYRRALALGGLPEALEEKTLERLAVALRQAGHANEAERVETRLDARFPRSQPR